VGASATAVVAMGAAGAAGVGAAVAGVEDVDGVYTGGCASCIGMGGSALGGGATPGVNVPGFF